MYTILATALADDRRRVLVADAVTFRQARAARRLVRRARSRVEVAPRPAARRYRVRPIVAFHGWVASGQL